jgi:hypothetical protein
MVDGVMDMLVVWNRRHVRSDVEVHGTARDDQFV